MRTTPGDPKCAIMVAVSKEPEHVRKEAEETRKRSAELRRETRRVIARARESAQNRRRKREDSSQVKFIPQADEG